MSTAFSADNVSRFFFSRFLSNGHFFMKYFSDNRSTRTIALDIIFNIQLQLYTVPANGLAAAFSLLSLRLEELDGSSRCELSWKIKRASWIRLHLQKKIYFGV